jgi:hypothetical protein
MIKICEYRNCNLTFNGRSNAKYCCKKCKHNECKYNQREVQRVEKEKKELLSLVRQFRESEINPTLVSLYNQIYKK